MSPKRTPQRLTAKAPPQGQQPVRPWARALSFDELAQAARPLTDDVFEPLRAQATGQPAQDTPARVSLMTPPRDRGRLSKHSPASPESSPEREQGHGGYTVYDETPPRPSHRNWWGSPSTDDGLEQLNEAIRDTVGGGSNSSTPARAQAGLYSAFETPPRRTHDGFCAWNSPSTDSEWGGSPLRTVPDSTPERKHFYEQVYARMLEPEVEHWSRKATRVLLIPAATVVMSYMMASLYE